MQQFFAWAGPIAALLASANIVYTFLTSGSKANEKKIGELETKLTDHDRRIQSVESELRHLPDKDMVVDLRLALEELKRTVAVMGEGMGSIGRTVHRIDDYLRSRDKTHDQL